MRARFRAVSYTHLDVYKRQVRKLCTDNGIVLAIDDVRAGFRLDNRGSAAYYGFEADLQCYLSLIHI